MKPIVTKERRSLASPSVYFLYGRWREGADAKAYLDDTELPCETEIKDYIDAQDRFVLQNSGQVNIFVQVTLPDPLPGAGTFRIVSVLDGEKEEWYRCSMRYISAKPFNPQFNIENTIKKPDGGLIVNGWTASGKEVAISAYDASGNRLETLEKRYKRPDVKHVYTETDIIDDSGFQLEIRTPVKRRITVVFSSNEGETRHVIALGKGAAALEKLRGDVIKTIRFTRANGLSALPAKLLKKARDVRAEVDYQEWIRHHLPSEEVLARQRAEHFAYSPLISVVVPVYRTPSEYLTRMIDSVRAQTYANWELILSDGSGSPSPVSKLLENAASADRRIRHLPTEDPNPLRIVENTNRAIAASRGEFIAFLDHDDELTPDALYECVRALRDDPDIEFIYTDEDKMNAVDSTFFQPNFKPDFNIDLLCTVNYICHFCVIKRALLDRAGMPDPAFEGAQDYDLVLRCTEKTDHIRHIPRILYHWRSHEDSTAENPESKGYAFEAGRRAVQAHYDRTGVAAQVITGELPGLNRTRFLLDHDPLISILVPNKDHIDDLQRCIASIEEKSSYRNFEWIIIENNSTDPATFSYYETLQKENPKARVVFYEGGFNFSLINNFGERYANGDYLLFLNNDTSIINEDCLEELLGYCTRGDVGAVGARLYYEDDTIQHAGVVVGFGGIAGHCFVQQRRGVTGYQDRIVCAADYSAVTAACMMVDRKAFREAGGFSPELAVAFNDVDLCLKLREKGYLIVYNPYAELYHYESKSRGLEDTPEKVSRFNQEIEIFRKRWPEIFKTGDPYYNPNLSLDTQDFSIMRNY